MLADLLRMNRLPESWIAPDPIRQLRELVRYRHKLSQMRTGLKGQVHSVMGKEGIIPTLVELWGPAGTAYLDSLNLADAYALRVESLRELIDVFDEEIHQLDKRIHQRLKDDSGYRRIQQLNGVGPVHAAVFVAEIGDVGRFPTAKKLCSLSGLTPKVKESDLKSYPQSISKLVRWSAGRRSKPSPATTAAPPSGSSMRGCGSAGPQHRPGGSRQKASHPRLLRAKRRRDPMPQRRGVRQFGQGQTASWCYRLTPPVMVRVDVCD